MHATELDATMDTDEFIKTLSADRDRDVGPEWRLLFGLTPAVLLSLAAVLLIWQPRPDLAQALMSPAIVKTAFPLMIGVVALFLSLRLAYPQVGAPVRAVMIGAGSVAGVYFFVALARAPMQEHVAAFAQSQIVLCLVSVPLLAAAPLAAILWALRSGATVHAPRCGTCAGLAAGGLGAAAYSIFCVDDSPVYFLPVYGAGIMAMGLAGRALGQRLLRW